MRKGKLYLGSFALSVVLVLALVLSPIASGAPVFNDISGHWAQASIISGADKDIINTTGDLFRPDDKVTNVELVSIYNRYYKVPETKNTPSYTDVLPGAWYYQIVADAEAFGYITKTAPSKGAFNPGVNITRQDAFLWLYTLMGSPAPKAGDSITRFSDASLVSSRYANAFRYLVGAGVIGGYPEDNTLRPTRTISRAEILVVALATPGVAVAPTAPASSAPTAAPAGSGGGSGAQGWHRPSTDTPSTSAPATAAPTAAPATSAPVPTSEPPVDVIDLGELGEYEDGGNEITDEDGESIITEEEVLEARGELEALIGSITISGSVQAPDALTSNSKVRILWQISTDGGQTWVTVEEGDEFTPTSAHNEAELRVVIIPVDPEIKVAITIDLGVISDVDSGVSSSEEAPAEAAKKTLAFRSKVNSGKVNSAYEDEDYTAAGFYDETPALGF
ncbi:MAG: S-layer homology domain-containing protein [Clostridiales bacterium]|nr:S-layer homology domain-containing protein [Clostridiales bacterium]